MRDTSQDTYPMGAVVTVRRTRGDRSWSWVGRVVSSGTMSCGGTQMNRLAIKQDDGREQHFAVDPWFATTVEVAS